LPSISQESVPVTVIVINFNSGECLARCLQALVAQTFRQFEVLVVDNASTDGSLERARESVMDGRIGFHLLGSNTGFAYANNWAAARARGRWLALLNPDAFAAPDWLSELLAAAARNPDIRIFGSLQLMDEAGSPVDGFGDEYLAYGFPYRTDHGRKLDIGRLADRTAFSACAAACLYRADLFSLLGGFDADFFCYCEDVDFGFRARLAGEECLQVAKARVIHAGGRSGAGKMAIEWGTRNLVWTFFKNMPMRFLVPLLPIHAAAMMVYLCIAASRGNFGPAIRGLCEGLRQLPSVWRKRKAAPKPMRSALQVISRMKWLPSRKPS